jgi:tRNA (adenine22-N1)-methyltransferase
MVTRHYQHIWDCCCDHGQLGIGFLARDPANTIHFVDIVSSIMSKLERQLLSSFPERSQQWRLHTSDVRELPIDQYPIEDSHLIVIAGVGGELSLKMVSALVKKYPSYHLEFLLCPVRHQYQLREGLSLLGLSLLGEELHKEQKWYYEIIHLVAVNANNNVAKGLIKQKVNEFPVEAAGSILWHEPSALHQDYLSKTIAHYQRSLRSLTKNSDECSKTELIIRQYEHVLRGIS